MPIRHAHHVTGDDVSQVCSLDQRSPFAFERAGRGHRPHALPLGCPGVRKRAPAERVREGVETGRVAGFEFCVLARERGREAIQTIGRNVERVFAADGHDLFECGAQQLRNGGLARREATQLGPERDFGRVTRDELDRARGVDEGKATDTRDRTVAAKPRGGASLRCRGWKSSHVRLFVSLKARVGSGSRAANEWRRERDSNPRNAFALTRFPIVPIKPLSHLSAGSSTPALFSVGLRRIAASTRGTRPLPRPPAPRSGA